MRDRHSQSAGKCLESALCNMMSVAPGLAGHMKRNRRCHGKGAIEFLEQIRIHLADTLALEGYIPGEVGPARDIHDHLTQRLIEWHQRMPEAGDALLVTQRLGKGLAEGDANILDGMMAIHMKVTVTAHIEVESAVLGKRGQHMVEKPYAAIEFGLPAAIKIDRNGDIGLTGLAVDAGLSGVCHVSLHKLFVANTRWPLGEHAGTCHLSGMSSSPASSPALDVLLSRASTDHLSAPAPDKEQIARILSAGLRAPDHGKMRPWRYIVIKGKHRAEFAEQVVKAMSAADPEVPQKKIDKRRQRFGEMPMTIALVMDIDSRGKIPVSEQELSIGAGAMNVLNALHAEGFGGFWVSSDFAEQPCFREALGLRDSQRLAGFLFVGTPDKPVHGSKRPDIAEYMAFWKGEPVSFEADK